MLTQNPERGNGAEDILTVPETSRTSDLANARRFVKAVSGEFSGPSLRYVTLWGKWLYWDERRWAVDEKDFVYSCAEQVVRDIYQEASEEEDKDTRKALVKWARDSESARRIREMIFLAGRQTGIPVHPDELDTEPWALNCQNGIVDLRTGKLKGHQKRRLLTKITGAPYDEKAEAPRWKEFLLEVFDGDEELIAFLRRAVGYSATADTKEQVMFLCWGGGRNGKSTFLEAIRAALGDYSLQTPSETLLQRRSGTIPNDIARLRGARFVTAIETDDGKRLAESLIKSLTGSDTVSARFMRSEFFEFRPSLKLWLATNHKPQIRGSDEAIWRRILLIPFGVDFRGREEKDLAAQLRAELPGILRWIVQGALEWQEHGLEVPPAVRAATAEYRSEQDIIGQFLDECCLLDPSLWVTSEALYQAFREWAEKAGETLITKTAFGLRLRERGFSDKRTKAQRGWEGVGLRR